MKSETSTDMSAILTEGAASDTLTSFHRLSDLASSFGRKETESITCDTVSYNRLGVTVAVTISFPNLK